MCVECLTIDLIWKMIFAELYDLHKTYWKKVLVLDQFITDMNQEVDFLVVGIPYGNGLNLPFFSSLLLVQSDSRIFSKSLSPFQHFKFCWTLIKEKLCQILLNRSGGILVFCLQIPFMRLEPGLFVQLLFVSSIMVFMDLGLVAWLVCRS